MKVCARSEGPVEVGFLKRWCTTSVEAANWLISIERPRDDGQIDRAKELLAAGMPIDRVASEVGYGWGPNFSRAFRREVGCSPTEWAIKSGGMQSVVQRVSRAELLLRAGTSTLLEVAKKVGFNSSQALTMAFKAVHGMSASEWVQLNRKVVIEVMRVPNIRRTHKKK